MRVSFIIILLLAMTISASAEIRIRESRLKDGTLIVRGETEPSRQVTLGGEFETKADRNGRFEFSVRHRPDDCLAEIRSGPDAYSAFVANCHSSVPPQ